MHAADLRAGDRLRRLSWHRIGSGRPLASNLFVDAPRELTRRIVSLELHEVVACGDLDQERKVAAGRDREAHVRLPDAQELVLLADDAEAIVFGALDPFLEFDDEIDRLH